MEIVPIIIFLYASTAVITLIGYLPTIRDLTKNVASANSRSYAIWTFTGCIGFLYALVVISDLLLEIVTALNLAFCVLILLLALKLEYAKKA